MSRGRAFLGVSLVSACVLMLQLALTRLFSATMYYHFAFMAISLALLGSAASGVAVYLLGPRADVLRPGRFLSLASLFFALSTVLALIVILANPLLPGEPGSTTLLRLASIYGASAVPFFFAGGAVTLAIRNFAAEMSRLYLYDLGGAAAGGLLFIPLLDSLGGVNTLLAISVGAAAAAALFESGGAGGRIYRGLLGLAGLALVGLLVHNLATARLDVRRAKGLPEAENVIFAKWNSFSRVTVWGNLEEASVLIMIDADAGTLILKDAGEPRRHRYLADRVESLAYHLKPGADALIMGPGGGIDVATARLFWAHAVTAVEVNPIVARDIMSAEPFRSYAGDVYRQPRVRLVVDEARSFLRRAPARYDVIQATMVDTWAATAAGAFALTENNLYTVEAFKDYAEHLSRDGLLSVTRWHLDPPDQLLRLTTLTRAMMSELGLGDPPRHVVIVRGTPEAGGGRAPATFLFKKSLFTDGEVRTIETLAARNDFRILYTPLTRPPNDFTRLLEAEDPAVVWRSLPSDVAPTRDNSPFFFQTVRAAHLGEALRAQGEWRKTNLGTLVLFGLLGLTTALTLLFILGPLALARGRVLTTHPGAKLSRLGYFTCLGTGFILVEVALVQKCILFLGHPVYALTVVLFSLLAWSALGSWLSGRIRPEQLRPRLLGILGGTGLLIAAAAVGLSPVFYALVHLDRALRIAVTVALLAPLGIAMGMPLPTGVRILAREAPEIIPWAWGVNGAASVMGSVAALVVALLAGFDQALLLGAAFYLLAILGIRRPAPPVDPAPGL
jgi:predicted membrane-bound spermidine synthase